MSIIKNITQVISEILKYLQRQLFQAVNDYQDVWDSNNTSHWSGWLAIFFAVCYAFFIICLWRRPVKFPVLSLPVFLLAFFVLQGKLFKACSSVSLRQMVPDKSIVSILEVTLLIFFIYLIYIFVYGTIESADTRSQWGQVLECRFDDWHPVIHTWSLYVLYKLVRFHFLVVMVFVAFFSHACGWLYVSLRQFGYHKKWSIAVVLLICLSPVTLKLLRVLWKDTAFGISILYLSVFLVHLWHNNGREFRWWQWLMFGFLLFYASFVRHNGFFFTVPILLFLPLAAWDIRAKFRLTLFSIMIWGCLAGYVGTRSYLKSCGIIHQRAKAQNFAEAVGLPMCVMSRVMVYYPEQMPKDAREFMLKICSEDEWKRYYKGDFNSIKFLFRNSYNVFLTVKPREFCSMFARTVKASPGCSLSALIKTTSLGVDPFWCDDICQFLYVYGKMDNGFLAKMQILMPWGWFFLAPGWVLLQLIVFGAYAFFKHGWRVLLMVAPFIAYTWGTSLLLNGCDHRYFWGILIAGIPIILLLISSHQNIEKNP